MRLSRTAGRRSQPRFAPRYRQRGIGLVAYFPVTGVLLVVWLAPFPMRGQILRFCLLQVDSTFNCGKSAPYDIDDAV